MPRALRASADSDIYRSVPTEYSRDVCQTKERGRATHKMGLASLVSVSPVQVHGRYILCSNLLWITYGCLQRQRTLTLSAFLMSQFARRHSTQHLQLMMLGFVAAAAWGQMCVCLPLGTTLLEMFKIATKFWVHRYVLASTRSRLKSRSTRCRTIPICLWFWLMRLTLDPILP